MGSWSCGRKKCYGIHAGIRGFDALEAPRAVGVVDAKPERVEVQHSTIVVYIGNLHFQSKPAKSSFLLYSVHCMKAHGPEGFWKMLPLPATNAFSLLIILSCLPRIKPNGISRGVSNALENEI